MPKSNLTRPIPPKVEEPPAPLPERIKRPKTGGRKKGSKNKRTLDKLRAVEIEVKAVRAGKQRLAIDHMDDMIAYLKGLVAIHRPWDEDGNPREGMDEKLWFRCLDAFRAFLSLRAPYQSPTLSAVAVMQSQDRQQRTTTVNVTILNERGEREYSDAMPDDITLIEGEITAIPASENDEEAA